MYNDVNVFCDRIVDVISYKGEAVVKANIQACLRGAVLTWFTSELSEVDKAELRAKPIQEGWLSSLR